MRLKKKMREGASRVARAVMAGVLAVGLAPSVAFADLTAGSLQTQADAMTTDGYVIAAAYAAAEPAPELLGLNNPNFRNTGEADNIAVMFGDPDINENPDPFVYNYKNDQTPGIYIGGRTGGGPMAYLTFYDTENADAAQNAVWALQPHIILGTGSDTIPDNEHDFYLGTASDVEEALGLESGSYTPIGVTYNRVNLPSMIATMYRLANAAKEAMQKDDTLKTRYEDPLAIAQDYERYIVGQKGLVKQAIDTGKAKKKTIALVQSYDSTASTFTIITDGVAEGTATTNRYLEAVQGVTYNYYDTVGADGATTVTADQLKENVDVIIIGSNTGAGGTGSSDSESLMTALSNAGLLARTFYCTNWGTGSVFGTTVNSVENAQNVGRILPCVYPEVLDQSDMIAYYYDTFYHIKNGKLADMIAENMDGVRNWDNTDSESLTAWETTTVSDYNHDAVQAKLIAGIGYLNSQVADPEITVDPVITPTDNVSADAVAETEIGGAEASSVTVSGIEDSYVYTGEAIAPEAVVKDGEATLVKGQDYLLSFADNVNVGTATATITGINKYSGTITKTFEITALGDVSQANFKKLDDEYAYTGEAITLKPSVTLNNVKLTQGTDFEVIVQQDGKDAEIKELGTYDVTVKGIGGYVGAYTKQIKVVPYFTVYLQKGTAAAEAVKSYKDASEFAALKSSSSDPVSALMFKDGVWQVSTAATYVTLDDLLEDAGIADQWDEGAAISYGKSNFTYEQIQARNKFFPDAQEATSGTETAAKDAPFVFSLTEYSGATDAENNAAAVEAANIAAANGNNTPRVVFGVSDEEYENKDAAGQRLWSGVASITIKVPAVDVTDTVSVALDKTSYTYTGKAFEPAVTVKVGDNTLTKDVDYTVAYSNNTKAGTATAKVTLTGAYTGSATANFTIAKATIAVPKAKTGLTYNGKAQTGVAAGTGYTVKNGSATNAGTYTATLTLKDAANYQFAGAKATATVKYTIAKAANPLAIAKATRTVKASKVKKAKKTVTGAKVKAKGQGAVTYAKVKVSKAKFKKYVTVNKKTGKITLKKGCPKGTFKVTVKAVAAGNANYAKSAAKKAVVTIKVK